MAYELFLIAAADTDATTTIARLTNVLATAAPSVLLIPTGDRDDDTYANHVETILPYAQRAGCAVLLDNRPELVRTLGADGVHMTGGIKALAEAVGDLKPDFIVGTGDIGTRHEAMVRGEMDIDYLMFGDRDDTDGAAMANWWAETFEIPSVYRAASPGDPALADIRTEFIALSGPDWEDPAKLKAIKGRGPVNTYG
ncbi:thiamine phosphate synthase [Pelagibacterium halotolerans]|uniref:thiamine phosphate synthase n=1 Tax=Pelagibacterium halotolerans TaxID=531813 RepID=UPI0038508542